MENYHSFMREATLSMAVLISLASAGVYDNNNDEKKSGWMVLFIVYAYAPSIFFCFVLNLLLFHLSLVRTLVRQPPPLFAFLNAQRLREAALSFLQLSVALGCLMMLLVALEE